MALRMTGRGFTRSIDCTCWLGTESCRKLVTMKTLLYVIGTGPEINTMWSRYEELLGVTNQDDGTVKGKYFDNWYVICTREQNYFLTKMCDPTHKKPGLERITEKEKEEKVRKRDVLWHFQPKKKLSLLWGLRLLTCHPTENSQAVILKTS